MRPKAHGHASQDRWLVSYADFITLLFAFFVMMYAASKSDSTKLKVMTDKVIIFVKELIIV